MNNQNLVGQWTNEWAARTNIPCTYSFETTSTNDAAKAFSYSSKDLHIFVCEHQTRGRGRGQHTWTDQGAGKCLLSSWSIGLDSSPQPITAALVGLAVACALEQTLGPRNLSLKAPNDLLIGSKKVAGLLIEAISEGPSTRLIVGFGLNVFQPAPLETATALEGHCTVPLGQEQFQEFLSTLLVEFTSAFQLCSSPEIPVPIRKDLVKYLNRNALLREPILSVEPDGSLRTKSQIISWSQL